jgi:hypothetical protein
MRVYHILGSCTHIQDLISLSVQGFGGTIASLAVGRDESPEHVRTPSEGVLYGDPGSRSQ